MNKSNLSTSLRFQDGVELLDTIDKLRGLGIDKEIPLPQIVVVGQQSSGKSSVLEAISGIPFPTNDGLCTRFATEVVLRRAPSTKTDVRIVRGHPSVTEDPDQDRISKFHSEVEAMSPIGTDKVPEIVAMAAKCLSLDSKKNFTKDFLRIEVSGPKQDHLTLVDLPGLFYYTKTGQDSTEPKIVKDLALRYMSEKRSIILAVLSAKTDYSTQEILQTLKDIDPDGSRTMGVITGVDQVERHSARESDYLALADNDITPLALGWHVLRNPSFTERQSGCDRDQLEQQFFNNQQPWDSVGVESRGASQLKTKLSHVLMTHIGRELKDVVATLDQKIEEHERTLRKCGDERTTLEQKKTYLMNIGAEYSALVKSALEGPYEDPFFFRTGERLRAKIRQASESFARNMARNGHRWGMIYDAQDGSEFLELEAKHSRRIGDRIGKDELDPLSKSVQPPYQITRKQYLQKINTVLEEHRRRELQGTFDPLLVGVLFRDQSCRWRMLAEAYVDQIASMLSQFVQRVIEHLTDAKMTRFMLGNRLQSALRERENVMATRLGEILKPFERSLPMTYNPLLRESLKAKQDEKSQDPTRNATVGSEGDDYACQQLMESMESYYSIALHTFVDNVTALGVELCLLDGLEKLFSALTVWEMNAEEVNRLASESPEDILHRRITQRKLEKFKAGRQVCHKWSLPDLETSGPGVAAESKFDRSTEPKFKFGVSRPTTPSHQQGKSQKEQSPSLSAESLPFSGDSDSGTDTSTQATTPVLQDKKKLAKTTGNSTHTLVAVPTSEFGSKPSVVGDARLPGFRPTSPSPFGARPSPGTAPRSSLTFDFSKMNLRDQQQSHLSL